MSTRRTTSHPAILALRAVVAAFVAAEQAAGRQVSSLLQSDLAKHDETAIRNHPDVPFAWVLHPMGTHLAMLLPDSSPYPLACDVSKPWPMMVTDAYSLDRLPSVGYYLWTPLESGGLLLPCSGPIELHARMQAVRAYAAMRPHEAEIVQLKLDLAALTQMETHWRGQLAARIAHHKQEITRLDGIRIDACAQADGLAPTYTVGRKEGSGYSTLCTGRQLRDLPVGLGRPYTGPGEYTVSHGDRKVTYLVRAEPSCLRSTNGKL